MNVEKSIIEGKPKSKELLKQEHGTKISIIKNE